MDPGRDFPALVRQHQDAVYAIALRLTGRPADAEDAAQEAFVRAFRALGTYDVDRRAALQVRPWLATIVCNVCRNHARATARRPVDATARVPEPEPTPGRSPADVAVERAAADELTAALRRLSDPQRRAVVLHHAGGLTYAEVATALGRPEGTVKADVHRALATLRSLLEPRELPA